MFNSNITSTFLEPPNNPQYSTPICTPTSMEITSDIYHLDLDHHFQILAAAHHEESNCKETTTTIAFSCLEASSNTIVSQNPFISSHGKTSADGSSSFSDHYMQPNYVDKGFENTVDINGDDVRFKIAFRTKSDIEIMDDGYRWRKYGKKKVKNSPNPRNYYRCSSEGCKVKKRVEKEREDPRFVITTYEGKHNHESPSPSPSPSAFNIIPSSHSNTLLPHTLQILHQP